MTTAAERVARQAMAWTGFAHAAVRPADLEELLAENDRLRQDNAYFRDLPSIAVYTQLKARAEAAEAEVARLRGTGE